MSQQTTDAGNFDKLDECEGRMSELLIDSATNESEAKRSRMVIDKIKDKKMKLGNKVLLRKTGRTKKF